MRITRWLWGLWGAMIVSMLLRRQADTYMIVALIIIPILIVLLDLHEEIVVLKEDNKHQRKFVMDRYNVLLDKMKDVSSQVEKRLVVDFAEFAKTNSANENVQNAPPMMSQPRKSGRKLKKRRKPESPLSETVDMDFHQAPPEENHQNPDQPDSTDSNYEDI